MGEIKKAMVPCIACCCFEYSLTLSKCCDPPLMGAFKLCCCAGSVACECFPCHCEPDPCYTEDRGICEVSTKACCCYDEVQFPPGKDIGIGCCGIGCDV